MSNPSCLVVKRLQGRVVRQAENQGWNAGKIAGIAVLTVLISAGLLMPPSVVAGDPMPNVKAHLEAGEYGQAIEKAMTIADESERAAQLRAISIQQEEAGDFAAARTTSRRVNRMNREQGNLQGGAAANPGPLMEMIRQLTGSETTGPWGEDGGDIGLEGETEVGRMMFYQNGVSVDPNGMLARLTRPELTNRLNQLGIFARKALLNQDLQKSSELRFVSLSRLEKELSERLSKGQQPSETMKLLGGLTGVKYIFVMPEEKELVIAGPAEAWRYNEHGLAVGAITGRPVLQLDDLVVLLRTFSPVGNRVFGCSIDPRAANLKATKEYLASINGPLAPGAMGGWLKQIEQRMGLQDIRIYGVPNNSRVARVIVDADYRMKLIGVGKMSGGKGIPSIFDLMAKSKSDDQLPLNAYRWWLTMKYDAVLHNESKNVYEIQGSSVLVKSEDQMISDVGKQVQSGKSSGVNREFAENFTKNYDSLAKQDLVFADLQNIFDLGMVAALCHREHLADKIGWNLGAFGNEGVYQPQVWTAPTTVKTVMAHRVTGGTNILVQAAGGVQANLLESIRNENLVRASADVKPLDREGSAPANLPTGRWWWNGSE